MESLIASKNNLSKLEKKLLFAVNEALFLSKPKRILRDHLKKTSSRSFSIDKHKFDIGKGKLYILGWGKLAAAMAESIESILGSEIITDGIVISTSTNYKTKKIRLIKGSHPFPSKANILATKKIINLTKKFTKDDSVLCLISGGGSSLLCLPVQRISLEDKTEAIKTMIVSGLSVQELNVVRKRLSDVKGGKLGMHIYPAKCINLIISDDVDNNIYSIASGATVSDTTTYKDALHIIKRYGLASKLPSSVMVYLQSHSKDKNEANFSEKSKIFSRTKTFIIFDHESLLDNIKKAARQNGFVNIEIYKKTLCGNIRKAVQSFCSFVSKAKKKHKDEEFIALAGGEAELKAKYAGKGGRCQHFAGLMIPKLERFNNASFAAIASDGKDFIEGISGALINNKTMKTAKMKKINYTKHMKVADTFNLHKLLNTHIFTTKPTENNVFDIYVFGQEKLKNK